MMISAKRTPVLGCVRTMLWLVCCVVGPDAAIGGDIVRQKEPVNSIIPVSGLRAIAPQTFPSTSKPTPIVVLMKSGSDVTVTLSEDGQVVMLDHISDAARRLRAHRPMFRHMVSQGGPNHLTVTATNSMSSVSVNLTISAIAPITEMVTDFVVHSDQSVSFNGKMNDATRVTCVHIFGDDTLQITWAQRGGDASATLHVYSSPGVYLYGLRCYNLYSRVDQERVVHVRPTPQPVIVIEALEYRRCDNDVSLDAAEVLPHRRHDNDVHADAAVVAPGVMLRMTFVTNFNLSEERTCLIDFDDSLFTITSVAVDDATVFDHTYEHEGNYTVSMSCYNRGSTVEVTKTVVVKQPPRDLLNQPPRDPAKPERQPSEDSALAQDNKSAAPEDDGFPVEPFMPADDGVPVEPFMPADDGVLQLDIPKKNIFTMVQK